MSGSLGKVGGHADRLEALADAMAKDGVGLDSIRGHAATLRRMASSMRADAANGRVPHAFSDNFYAAAEADQVAKLWVAAPFVQIAKVLSVSRLAVRWHDQCRGLR